ncbi:MAG: HEPN domain-containing protein [Candidatus Aenigmarchaeota archaeon]|nr:HEPN domain-containing protein [Candidatus Aenigmarchaeota archaeon]MBU5688843.1 HEPN domain-containing protein [Candidatus Aenigmarchaeota archaeon]
MSVFEDGLFLKKRAIDFLENGKRNLYEGKFDLAAFNLEQSIQLFLKYLIFQKKGDYPKTHSLKSLFKEISEYIKDFEKILKSNVEIIGDLESAYIGARYLPIEFLKEEVEKMVEFSEKIKNLVEKHEKK